jgi:hypothetical protein
LNITSTILLSFPSTAFEARTAHDRNSASTTRRVARPGDRVGAVEDAGVEYLPEDARDSSPRNLGAVFLGANLTWTNVVFGARMGGRPAGRPFRHPALNLGYRPSPIPAGLAAVAELMMLTN